MHRAICTRESGSLCFEVRTENFNGLENKSLRGSKTVSLSLNIERLKQQKVRYRGFMFIATLQWSWGRLKITKVFERIWRQWITSQNLLTNKRKNGLWLKENCVLKILSPSAQWNLTLYLQNRQLTLEATVTSVRTVYTAGLDLAQDIKTKDWHSSWIL